MLRYFPKGIHSAPDQLHRYRTMAFLLSTFQVVSIIFAIAAVDTGAQALVDPVGFSISFGLPVALNTRTVDAVTSRPTAVLHSHRSLTMSYISLLGVRQLATGLILLTFACQNKWTEMATILAIIGVIVAGTDGIFLSRFGAQNLGRLHAIPGALIAALAGGVIYLTA